MYRVDYESVESLNRLAVILRDTNSYKIGNVIPPKVAKSMVSLIPDEWFEPKGDELVEKYKLDLDKYTENHRVLDICCNSGVLLAMFMNRFYDVLHNYKNFTEETDLCYEYILKNLVYGICSNKFLCREIRGVLYNNKNVHGIIFNYGVYSEVSSNNFEIRDGKVFIYDSIKKEKIEMKFDIVCGNPPYNNDMYLDFVQLGHKLAKTYDLWITPAKFIAKDDKSGKNDNFRKVVLGNIKDLVLYIHTHEVFSILSDGGIAYYLCDKNSHTGINVKNICNEVPDLVNSNSQLVKNKDIEKYSLINISDSILDKLYSNGFQQYHPKKADELNYNFYLTSQFGGSGAPTNRFFANDGKALVLSDYEILKRGDKPKSGTTMRLFSSDDLDECNNYLSWIYSKFVRFLLVCGMCVRSSVSDECWRFVPDPLSFDKIYEDKPLDDYTPDENGEYNDKDGNTHCSLYAKYKLTDKEISVIESVIRERK